MQQRNGKHLVFFKKNTSWRGHCYFSFVFLWSYLKSPSFGCDCRQEIEMHYLLASDHHSNPKFQHYYELPSRYFRSTIITICLFGRGCFQVLTIGAKLIFNFYCKLEVAITQSSKLQTLVEKTWMQPVHHPPKEQQNCEQIWPSSLVVP